MHSKQITHTNRKSCQWKVYSTETEWMQSGLFFSSWHVNQDGPVTDSDPMVQWWTGFYTQVTPADVLRLHV